MKNTISALLLGSALAHRNRKTGQPIGHSGCKDRSIAAGRCTIRSNTVRRSNRNRRSV